jgi:hypothetical protein
MNSFHYKQDPLYNAAAVILQGSIFEAEQKENQALTEQTFSKDVLKSILNTMETQSFYDWYEKDFTDYIQGDADGKTQEEILDDLNDFFN